MTNAKTTKRALVSSVLALFLCFAMLLGTTFAWFTDSVTSANNIIKSGNLDITLEYWDGDSWEDVKDKEDILTNELWEPGVTEVAYFRIKNAGSLALKYQFGVNIVSETAGVNKDNQPFKLSDYIYFDMVEGQKPVFADRDAAMKYATETTKISAGYAKADSLMPDDELYLAMVVYMPTTVGNEANHNGTSIPQIDLGINIMATQMANEKDSFGPDYDEDAPWLGGTDTTWYNDTDTSFTLTKAEELAGLAELVNAGNSFEGKTVTLGADVDLNNVNWTPIGVSGSPFKGTFIGTGYTISNLKAVGEAGVGLFGRTFVGAHIEGVTVVNAYVSGNDYVGVIVGGGYLAKNCIKNCVVENATVVATPYQKADGVYDGGAKAGVIVGQAYNGNIIGNTVKNSTVTAYRDLGGIAGMLDFDGNSTVEASGNTVENVTMNYIGVAGKYDGDKPNQNMGAIVGRVGSKAIVNEDANTATDVTMNETNKNVTMIYTLEELIAFANDVNAGNTYAGKTVLLGADINLVGMEWTPIGTGSGFNGTFDGNQKTISNLKISGNKSTVGLFANTYNGEIKNLTIENAIVSGRLNVGVVAGNPYTSKYTNIKVTGHVEVNGMSYVGGVGGKNAYANWENITVDVDETSYVKAISTENGTAYRTYVGGVVGFNGEGGHSFTNITSNIDVIGDVCDIGGVFGIAHYGNIFKNITCTGNVTNLISSENDGDDAATDVLETGLIAGVWHNQNDTEVSFENISATGTISTPNVTPAEKFPYEGLVGKKYSATGTGTLIIFNYVDKDGVTLANDLVNGKTILYLVPADYEGTTVNVPEGVDTIGGYAFAYNSNIETIKLSSTVTTLNDRAFRDTSASTVILNEGLTNISYQAFRNASNITKVEIPSTVTTISKEAFQYSGITTLTIPANVTTIEYGGCRDMKELVNVTIEGDVDIPVFAFRACTKLESVTIKGNNVTFGGGSRGMIFTNKENGDGSAITVTVANEVIKARLLAADTAAKDYGGYTINCKQSTATDENGESLGYYVDKEKGIATAYDATGLVNALNNTTDIKNVVLAGDVTVTKSEAGSNGYGATGIHIGKGQTLDGNDQSLGVNAWSTWDSAINITGGTIKNLTVNSGMRGIFINHNSDYSDKVILENVIIDGTIYTISCDQGTGKGLEAYNSTFNGWTSYAATIGDVKFVDCSFGAGQGYAYCRPYAPTEFVGCDFEAGFEIDARAAVTFENCTIGGEPLTAENLATLVTSGIANATVK